MHQPRSPPRAREETGTWQPSGRPRPTERRSGELTPRELLRWAWRQLTSMRTALVLLLLLALGAIPGSVIPQGGVDALKTRDWQAAHPHADADLREARAVRRLRLAVVRGDLPAADGLAGRLHRAAAVRLLARAAAPQPPAAPRNLTRLPDHASYTHRRGAGRRARARAAGARCGPGGYRRLGELDRRRAAGSAAERGYLREAGNLLFHLSVLVVLVGFAIGSLFGYKGGVILVVGNGFSNNLTQYDDFDPGGLFDADGMEPFCFTVDDFDVRVADSGPRQGMARGFQAPLTYRESAGRPVPEQQLRPPGQPPAHDRRHRDLPDRPRLRAGDHRPRRAGARGLRRARRSSCPRARTSSRSAWSRRPDAQPGQDIGLEGLFYPTYATVNGDPVNVMGDDRNPTALAARLRRRPRPRQRRRRSRSTRSTRPTMTQLKKPDGKMFRVDLQPGQTVQLPDGAGSVTFARRQALDPAPDQPDARRLARPCSAWCWRWSGCSARCSSGRAGSGCAPGARTVRRWSRWPHWTGRGAVT